MKKNVISFSNFISFIKYNYKKSMIIVPAVYLFFTAIFFVAGSIFLPFENNGVEIFLSASNIVKAGLFYLTPQLFLALFAFPAALYFLSLRVVEYNNTDYRKANYFGFKLKRFFMFFILTIFIGIIKVVFYLPVIPGIIISVLLLLYPVYYANNDLNVFTALKLSICFGKKHFIRLFFIIVLIWIMYLFYHYFIQNAIQKIFPLYTHIFFDNMPLYQKNVYYNLFLNCLADCIFTALESLFYLYLHQIFTDNNNE